MDIAYKVGNIQDGDHTANDPANQAWYRIQLSPDNTAFWNHNDWSGPTYNTRTTTVSTHDGKYYWRGILKDEHGNQSGGSASKYLTIDTKPPSVPKLPPLPEYSPGIQVELVAQKSTDAIAPQSSIAYYLEVSSDPAFTDASKNIGTVWQVDNTLFQIPGLQDETTYYYRIKAKDRPSGAANVSDWSAVRSSTQDATIPVVSNQSTSIERFSPSNPTSIGIQDRTQVSFTFVEKYFDRAEVEVRDVEGKLIRTIRECEHEGVTGICNNNLRGDAVTTDPTDATFTWDGTQDDGTYAPDGVYSLRIVVRDKAGNANDLGIAESTRIVILDDTGANIGIVSPANDSWTNKQIITIQGAVAGYNQEGKQDRDFAKLEVRKEDLDGAGTGSSGHDWQDITDSVDEHNNFTHETGLDKGTNTYSFRSTDTVGNEIDRVGDPNASPVLPWHIHHETANPHILTISPQGLLENTTPGSSKNPQITFTLQDHDPTGEKTQVSDLQTGTNPSGYTLSLLRSFDGTTWSEVPLFVDGTNVASGSPRLAGNLTCTQPGGTGTEVTCTTQLTNLQPDARYKLFIKTTDRAGNSTCNKNYTEINEQSRCSTEITENHPVADRIEERETEFVIDSHTYLEVQKPVDGAVLNH